MFVSLGSAADNIEAACDYLREQRNAKVGSIHINVIRPFPEVAVIKALRGKKNVIILERTDEGMAGLLHSSGDTIQDYFNHILSIFQPFQPVQDDGHGLLGPQISDDAAHSRLVY